MELYPVIGQVLAAEATSRPFRDLERDPRRDGSRGRGARKRRRRVFSLQRPGGAGGVARWRAAPRAEAGS